MGWLRKYKREDQDASAVKGTVDTAAVKARVEGLIGDIRSKLDDLEEVLADPPGDTITGSPTTARGKTGA